MLEAILFDLDNTLILFDEQAFFQQYIPSVARHFTDLFEPEIFRDRLLSSTQAMTRGDESMTNAQRFMKFFVRDMEEKHDMIWQRFLNYYEKEFNGFRTIIQHLDSTVPLMNALQERPLKLIIASNPFWPLLVQEMRLDWAGLEHIEFDWITHVENSSYCKPDVRYFHEICKKMDLSPEKCLMVGNDPLNDMIAGHADMKTYLTTDCLDIDGSLMAMSQRLREKSDINPPEPDYKGPLAGVLDVVDG